MTQRRFFHLLTRRGWTLRSFDFEYANRWELVAVTLSAVNRLGRRRWLVAGSFEEALRKLPPCRNIAHEKGG